MVDENGLGDNGTDAAQTQESNNNSDGMDEKDDGPDGLELYWLQKRMKALLLRGRLHVRRGIAWLSQRGTCYRARNPPSIGKTCPVIKEAASEHSHTTAPATSSGVPNRPIGCSAINCGSSSGVWKPPRSVIGV